MSEPSIRVEPGGRPTHLEGSVLLTRTQRGILVQAHLRTTVSDQCSRCLRDIEYPVEVTIEEEFFPVVDPVTGVRLPEPEEPSAFRIDERHHLNLTEAAREYIIGAEQMQPLCRPDCAGLCPVCGADLNAEACGCDKSQVDPRWAALAQLRDEGRDEERR